VGGACEPAGFAIQLAQENPLVQLDGDEQATSGEEDVLAKLEIKRSTFSLSQLGHVTPSVPASIFWMREKVFSQSLQRYS
jgi:hypothetical protein